MSNASAPLTVVSCGGGQDSTAIIYRLGLDPEFRARFAPGHVLCVMAATGDEHAETNAHVPVLAAFCAAHDMEFVHLDFAAGWHSGPWSLGLANFYKVKNAIGSQAYPKTCTDNLKVQPIYRFLAHYLAERFGGVALRKSSLYDYTAQYGKLRVIIGIAAGEETRIAPAIKERSQWMAKCIEKCYPLVETGWDRAACQAFILSTGAALPPPSNCFMCPFKSPIELLWSSRHDRARWDEWVRLEAMKLLANARMGAVVNAKTGKVENKNFGVGKLQTLPMMLASAEARYGHMTDAQLDDYRMSHGHCVKSAY